MNRARELSSVVFALAFGCGGQVTTTSNPNVSAGCEPLSEMCAASTPDPCIDWTKAQELATWCAMEPSHSNISIVSNCDGFDIVGVGIVDTEANYYYDAKTGEFVGESFGSKDGHGCFGQVPTYDGSCYADAAIATCE